VRSETDDASGRGAAALRPARVVVADDHEIVRAGLVAILSSRQTFQVVGEAADGEEALTLNDQLRPDLVLIDVAMDGLDGLAAIELIRRHHPEAAPAVVAMCEDTAYLRQAMAAGAAAYLLKGATRHEVLQTARRALRGETAMRTPHLSPQLLAQLAGDLGAGPDEPLSRLTPREAEVLRLLAEGKTNRDIGLALTLSLSTVKTHVEHILDKLNVADRTAAAVRASELGMLLAAAARPQRRRRAS
jgi:DNA-binding NarL/FixJ family response regulator